MRKCRRIEKHLPVFLLEELPGDKRARIEAHLADCGNCRRRLAEMQTVMTEAEAYRQEVDAAASEVDWEAVPREIAARIFVQADAVESEKRRTPLWSMLWRPQLRPVYAALLLGVIVGASLTLLVVQRKNPMAGIAGDRAVVPSGLLDDMTVEVARRETLDYLTKSRYLLLDFIQSGPEVSADFWRSDFASHRTRALLSQKKFINPQLDQYKMAKAKAICDQIEWLFLELTQVSEELTSDELDRVRRHIQERQLLLKINLVERELSSESTQVL